MGNPLSIVWFRQDLRLTDNPALYHAVELGKVLPVFIYDDHNPDDRKNGAASDWWLHHSLNSISKQLDDNLLVFKGDPIQILPQLSEHYQCDSVFWNRCYEPWQIKRDAEIKQRLKFLSINVQSFNGHLLWEPQTILKSDGTPYRVFTPYYRKGCLKNLSPKFPIAKPNQVFTKTPLPEHQKSSGSEGIENLGLLPQIPWDQDFYHHWQPGEVGASNNLSNFLDTAALTYRAKRDIPGLTGTSKLSPHLHFGEISINQVWYAIWNLAAQQSKPPFDIDDLDCYLSELGWREFSYYLLYHFPHLPNENFQPKFDNFPWQYNPDHLKKWQQGQTGIPMVDAGMRELWQTGYMHNRVRMITASFLVKNLLIDWREGEKWFWDCLVDADLASNSAGWQWVAGSGADAAPYFRIFNPITQGCKFDPTGKYVKRFCPELINLPEKYIHAPWTAPEKTLQLAKVQLGNNYPLPIVDLADSRKKALEALSICRDKK